MSRVDLPICVQRVIELSKTLRSKKTDRAFKKKVMNIMLFDVYQFEKCVQKMIEMHLEFINGTVDTDSYAEK